jgi:hypothetical protein
LANREARQSAPSGTDFPSQKHWAAISAAHDFVGKKEKSFIVAYLYDEVRTYFVENS